MTDTTVTVAVTKPESKQWTNYAAGVVGVVGNLLPILTPDFLAACGVSPNTAHVISTIAAVLLAAYREKHVTAQIVSSPSPESAK